MSNDANMPTTPTSSSGPLKTPSLRIYAPTTTEDWIRCPIYRQYKRKWQPTLEGWQPNLLIGKAVHAGLAEWYLVQVHSSAHKLAESTLVDGYVENDEWTLDGVKRITAKALDAAISDNIWDTETIVSVERDFGDGRADLITRVPEGLIVTDTKFTMHLKSEYLPRRLQEYDTSHQLWHYAWQAQETYQEKVAWVRVQLVVGSPKTYSKLFPIRVTEARMRFWLSGAEWAWQQMEAEERGDFPPLPRFPSCHGKFGRCVYYDACHVLDGDETLIANTYDRVEPRETHESS